MRAIVSAEGGFFDSRFFFTELFAFYCRDTTLLPVWHPAKIPECEGKPQGENQQRSNDYCGKQCRVVVCQRDNVPSNLLMLTGAD